jgi:transcriptional regulator with XRE-family HTH domain
MFPRANGISRVENGHTVPTAKTREKIAQALEASLYRLFYDDDTIFTMG